MQGHALQSTDQHAAGKPSAAPEEFWQSLRAAAQRLLVLDYDGTLAPFTTERDAAWPYAGVREELAAISAETGTRVVVMTGRSVDDARRLLGVSPAPEIWGSHGLERMLQNGTRVRRELTTAQVAALQQGEQLVRRFGDSSSIEVKPGCIAFHWRGKDEADIQRLEKRVRSAWKPLAEFGLQTLPFDGGLELRAREVDKGDAVNQLLAELGSNYVAAYLGDDLTDEDAFRALSGKGLTVLVRPEYRQTLAQVWLRPPDELLAFLRKWKETTADE